VRTMKRLPGVVLVVVVLFATVGAAWAQDADVDKAKRGLADAIAKYKAFDFRTAQQILLKQVKRDRLPAAEQKQYDQYLTKLRTAVPKQQGAMGAYRAAQKALKANDLANAKKGFEAAAASQYLAPGVRADAKKQLALVNEKIKVAAKPVTVVKPKATPKADPKPKPVTDEATERMLARLEARQARATRLLADGKKALDNRKSDEAVKLFEAALKLNPRLTEAKDLLEKARALVASKDDVLSRYEQFRLVAKQEAALEFDKSMKRSLELLTRAKGKADYKAADAAARLAEDTLAANKRLYTVVEYRARLTRIENQFEHIRVKRTEWEVRQVAIQKDEIAGIERQRIEKEERQRREKLQTLRDHAVALRRDCKYEKAIEVLRQIVRLAGGGCEANSWAIEQIEILLQFSVLGRERSLLRTRGTEEQEALLQVRDSEIPWHKLINYPRDWAELTLRRVPFGAGRGSESEADRAVHLGLMTKIPRLNLTDIEFKDAVDFLRNVSGVSILVSWGALEVVDITKESPINVVLKNVTAGRALRAVLENVGGGVTELGYNIDEGVVTISTKDDLAKKTGIRVYDIRDLIYRIPNFSGPRIELSMSGAGNAGNNGSGDSGGGLFDDEGTDGEGGDGEEAEGLTKAEIILKIIELIQKSVDPTSWQPNGEIGSVLELHGQLVITQTPDNHTAIRGLIAQLREARALQIAIEARFISVSTGFLQNIGIDLDFYFNLGTQLGTGTRTLTDPWTGSTLTRSGAGRGSLEDALTPISVLQNTSAFTTGMSSGVATDIGGSVASLGASGMTITGTFLDDIEVDFMIRATQAHSSTRSLTAPRLTLFNGQRAYVTVATQQAYISDLEPVVSDNAVSFNPTVSFVPTGSVLDVEATISADRRYVTLTVRPQVASLNGFTTYFTSVTSTDANGDAITGVGQIQLPNVTVQDLQTTVSVPDGGTLLIGGQKIAGEMEREMGVPLLSKIPIINRAFTNRGMVRDEQTLLIMIKPKIIIQQEEEDAASP